jgi:hypothetical protein
MLFCFERRPTETHAQNFFFCESKAIIVFKPKNIASEMLIPFSRINNAKGSVVV